MLRSFTATAGMYGGGAFVNSLSSCGSERQRASASSHERTRGDGEGSADAPASAAPSLVCWASASGARLAEHFFEGAHDEAPAGHGGVRERGAGCTAGAWSRCEREVGVEAEYKLLQDTLSCNT